LNTLYYKWTIARKTRRDKGMLAVFAAIFRFLIKPIYQNDSYYLYRNQLRKDYDVSECDHRLDTHNLSFKVVSSNQEADGLEAEGYKFRSYPTDFNDNLTTYRRWLDCGVIAFCTFAEKEFAAISWIVPSQQAQDKIKTLPLKVDYSNHEVLIRGSWTNPKYRGLGIFRFTAWNRNRFLIEKEITMFKSPVSCTKIVGQSLSDAMGGIKYGRGRMLKIMWWRFWRETSPV